MSLYKIILEGRQGLVQLRNITIRTLSHLFMSFKNGPSDWKIESSKNVYDNQDLSVYEDTIDLGGVKRTYIRGVRRDYCAVVPFISSNNILLIKRYRHLTDSIQLEIPFVSVNQGEEPGQAAKRALAEKTGHTASEIASVGSYTLDYTMLEQKGHIFAAYSLQKIEKKKSEDMERIDVITMPIEEVKRHLREGKITDASSIAALYRALDYDSKRLPRRDS